MTCEDCAKQRESDQETLDAIRTSQTQMAAQVDWIVKTVDGMRQGFEQMMSNGGPLAMLKMLRKG